MSVDNATFLENHTRSLSDDYNGTYMDYMDMSNIPEDNLSVSLVSQWIWTVVFYSMIIIAIGGNTVVIWIVIAHNQMRTVTNYFLVNLSIADLLLTTLNCTFNHSYMLQGNWQFGDWYCTINNFIAHMTVPASVFTLSAISCDRYVAIVHPLEPRMSKLTSLLVICFIWMCSMAFALPAILFSTTLVYRFRGRERTACLLIWPDGQPTISQMDFAYNVLFLIITYAIPVVLMVCCYAGMAKVLWGSQTIGEQTQRQTESIKSKRKIVKMFIFLLLVFGICWLPYHAYFIYTYFDPQILYSKYVQQVYLGFYWFAMSNAMVNPLIYYFMNARFRKYFKAALYCCNVFERNRKNKRRGSNSTYKSGATSTSLRIFRETRKTLSTKLRRSSRAREKDTLQIETPRPQNAIKATEL